MKKFLVSVLLLLFWQITFGQTTSRSSKRYTTQRISERPPTIDGEINDPAWGTIAWGGNDFRQWRPDNGEAPTEQTAFKVLYDDKNLYIAYRCHDKNPDKIEQRMSRRDGFEGDWVEVNIDSYFDKRTAFSFTISVSGVKGDELISNDGNNWDASWDPIWYAKTNIDDKGWTAEIRIPLSQLRYGNKTEHIWGIQFHRRNFRHEERSLWSHKPANTQGWVSFFGELHGISGIKPQKQVEIMPYVLGQMETSEVEEGNPFATGTDRAFTAGVDGKIGVTSDFTVDFTINPDFGQVEADPSALRLDGFENFFSEQRPFFIENRNIFDYRVSRTEAGGPFGSDNLFYSRRIGRSPHYSPSLQDHEYADVPANSSILGAAKFSGKTKDGLSIGILESVTAREMAEIDSNGERREEEVEPLTNYFVGRLQQDFKGGETVIGGIFTATNRDIDTETLDFLHTSAYTGGVDFLHRWDERQWYVATTLLASRVNGSTNAIRNTQESQGHLFHRLGADHLQLDTTLTSLSGHGGTAKIGKIGNLSFEGGVTWRSPGVELNDIGFMRSADYITEFFWAGYRFPKPFSIFRSLRFNVNQWLSWDYGGLHTYRAYNANAHAEFTNYWGVGFGGTHEDFVISTSDLRGGPPMKYPSGQSYWMYAYTDGRKQLRFNVNFNAFNSPAFQNAFFNLGIRYQPLRTLNISIFPSYGESTNRLQYVDTKDFNDETRYISATIDRKQFSASIRLNYTINPNLSIQYYGSPFIVIGNYSDFKYITNSLADKFTERFHTYNEQQIRFDEEADAYLINEDLNASTDYTVDNPDFNFMQFRSNLVARWEYIPGSVLFLVWSQGLTNFGEPSDQLFPSLRDNLFDNKATNIFLLKFTYRFLL